MRTLPQLLTLTEQIYDPTPELYEFFRQCDTRGFQNNIDLNAMKWHWCIKNGGAWFATYKADGTIISVSGIHRFLDGYRALFRGAQLEPRPDVGLNRYHMQSYCFHSQLPHQIEFSKHLKPIYITTNVLQDRSGMMKRIDSAFHIFARLGLVDFVAQRDIFNATQNIWQLNVQRYTEIRAKW